MSKQKIIVIDDDDDSREICRRILTDQNFEVSTLNDAEGAPEHIRNLDPSLILSDWDMPLKGGLELIDELQSDKHNCEIPVIMMTGKYTSPQNLRTALEKGASDFISKPLNEIELVARVKSAVKTYSILREKEVLMKEIIERKEREVSTFHANIIRNKKLLETIKNEISSLLTESNPYRQAVMQVIEKYEKQNNHVNTDINEQLYTELTSAFTSNLKKMYPDLTKGEIKLCEFFRMGYGYKDVSNLLYMNYEAVRKAVYRIKKKLQVTQTLELIELLQKIE